MKVKFEANDSQLMNVWDIMETVCEKTGWGFNVNMNRDAGKTGVAEVELDRGMFGQFNILTGVLNFEGKEYSIFGSGDDKNYVVANNWNDLLNFKTFIWVRDEYAGEYLGYYEY